MWITQAPNRSYPHKTPVFDSCQQKNAPQSELTHCGAHIMQFKAYSPLNGNKAAILALFIAEDKSL